MRNLAGAFARVLVLAPHTDDAELGAGGFLARLVEEGAQVSCLAFSAAEESVPAGFEKDILRREAVAASGELGIPADNVRVLTYPVRRFGEFRQDILESMISIRRSLAPELVLLPSSDDLHQDHAVIAQEGLRAFKRACVLGYELPWNNRRFDAACFVALQATHLQKKCDALAQYASQGARDYLSADFTRGLAKVRGVQSGHEFAEAFEVMRWHIH